MNLFAQYLGFLVNVGHLGFCLFVCFCPVHSMDNMSVAIVSSLSASDKKDIHDRCFSHLCYDCTPHKPSLMQIQPHNINIVMQYCD